MRDMRARGAQRAKRRHHRRRPPASCGLGRRELGSRRGGERRGLACGAPGGPGGVVHPYHRHLRVRACHRAGGFRGGARPPPCPDGHRPPVGSVSFKNAISPQNPRSSEKVLSLLNFFLTLKCVLSLFSAEAARASAVIGGETQADGGEGGGSPVTVSEPIDGRVYPPQSLLYCTIIKNLSTS